MTITHQIIRPENVPAALMDTIHNYYADEFGRDAIFGEIEWAEPEWYTLTFEDDQWVSVLEIHRRTIKVGDGTVFAGGISGVFTPPERRGHGYAGKAVLHAVDFMHREFQPEFGLLICKLYLIPLYEALGFQVVDTTVTFQQDDGAHVFPAKVQPMIYPFTDRAWLPGAIMMDGKPW